MNPADIDPTLRTGARTLDSLDDGFSPPPASTDDEAAPQTDLDYALATKSLF